MILLIMILVAMCSMRARKLAAKIRNYLFWDGSIRLYTVAYLNLCLFSLLNYSNASKDGNSDDNDGGISSV